MSEFPTADCDDNIDNSELLEIAKSGDFDKIRPYLLRDKTLVNNCLDWVGDGIVATASWHGQALFIQSLIDNFRIDINSLNNNGSSPLHRASASGEMSCAMVLLDNGADPELKDNLGKRPIDCAVKREMRQLIKSRVDATKAFIRETQIKMEIQDKEFDNKWLQDQQIAHENLVSKRITRAIPIVVEGSSLNAANGVYDPIGISRHDWPIYRKRFDSTLPLVTLPMLSNIYSSSTQDIVMNDSKYSLLKEDELFLDQERVIPKNELTSSSKETIIDTNNLISPESGEDEADGDNMELACVEPLISQIRDKFSQSDVHLFYDSNEQAWIIQSLFSYTPNNNTIGNKSKLIAGKRYVRFIISGDACYPESIVSGSKDIEEYTNYYSIKPKIAHTVITICTLAQRLAEREIEDLKYKSSIAENQSASDSSSVETNNNVELT